MVYQSQVPSLDWHNYQALVMVKPVLSSRFLRNKGIQGDFVRLASLEENNAVMEMGPSLSLWLYTAFFQGFGCRASQRLSWFSRFAGWLRHGSTWKGFPLKKPIKLGGEKKGKHLVSFQRSLRIRKLMDHHMFRIKYKMNIYYHGSTNYIVYM